MKLTFENIDRFIGRKIRIIKVCAPFIGKDALGKVDYIESVDNVIFLKKLKKHVNPEWIELVNDDAVDIEMEVNENTIFNPFSDKSPEELKKAAETIGLDLTKNISKRIDK